MLKSFRQHIARIFCLFLALYILNFSVDVPSHVAKQKSPNQHLSESTVVESLLLLVLDIHLDIPPSLNKPGDFESEKEKETVDSYDDLFHLNNHLLLKQGKAFLFTKHSTVHDPFLNSRIMDTFSPPPQLNT